MGHCWWVLRLYCAHRNWATRFIWPLFPTSRLLFTTPSRIVPNISTIPILRSTIFQYSFHLSLNKPPLCLRHINLSSTCQSLHRMFLRCLILHHPNHTLSGKSFSCIQIWLKCTLYVILYLIKLLFSLPLISIMFFNMFHSLYQYTITLLYWFWVIV